MYEHLRGDKTPFVAEDGTARAGDALKRELAAEGVGAHQLTFAGLLLPPDATDRARLRPWQVTISTVGTLDVDGLARLAHVAARRAITTNTRQQGTPPELYLTAIDIRSPQAAPAKRLPAPAPIRAVRKYLSGTTKAGKRRVVYRDVRTGKFVSRAVWQNRTRK